MWAGSCGRSPPPPFRMVSCCSLGGPILDRTCGAVDVDAGESFVLPTFYKAFALPSSPFTTFISEYSFPNHHCRFYTIPPLPIYPIPLFTSHFQIPILHFPIPSSDLPVCTFATCKLEATLAIPFLPLGAVKVKNSNHILDYISVMASVEHNESHFECRPGRHRASAARQHDMVTYLTLPSARHQERGSNMLIC